VELNALQAAARQRGRTAGPPPGCSTCTGGCWSRRVTSRRRACRRRRSPSATTCAASGGRRSPFSSGARAAPGPCLTTEPRWCMGSNVICCCAGAGSSWCRRGRARRRRRRCGGAPPSTPSRRGRPSRSGGPSAGGMLQEQACAWTAGMSMLRGLSIGVAMQHWHLCRRLGSEACKAKVTLEVNWQPQRFKLSPALSSLLGVQSDTRARVLQVRPPQCCAKHSGGAFAQVQRAAITEPCRMRMGGVHQC
jgi:hypothetical protein